MSRLSDDSLHAVILAGGVRSGHELSCSQLPRALWPMPSEPVITGVIRFLKERGVRNISICANGKTKMIAEELAAAKEPFSDLHFSEDRFPRGPAGCLKDLAHHLGEAPFIVIQGTGFYDFDLSGMLLQHLETDAAVTVGAVRRDSGQGNDSWEPAGVYIISPAVLRHVASVGYQDLKEQLLPKVRAAGEKILCHRIEGSIKFVHGVEHYLDALPQMITRAGSSADLEKNGYQKIREDVFVHSSAQVDSTARIVGPVWVEEGAEIAAGALVIGPALVGRNVRVGKGTLLRRVALLPNAEVNNLAEVADSVVAPGVRVERRSASGTFGEPIRQPRLLGPTKPESLLKKALRTMDILRVGPADAQAVKPARAR